MNGNSNNLIISEEVIAKIASAAAKEVEGVADVVNKPMAVNNVDSIKSVIKTKKVMSPVRVEFRDNQIMLDVYVRLCEGIKIADVALTVQQKVKEEVQNMTGKVVSRVNLYVCEVELCKDKKDE